MIVLQCVCKGCERILAKFTAVEGAIMRAKEIDITVTCPDPNCGSEGKLHIGGVDSQGVEIG